MTDHKQIELSQVFKNYQRGGEKLLVLNDISLSINESDFVALMGPSGSGKTTLLNLISGLDKADKGKVVVGNTDLCNLGERQLGLWRARHVGIVFQFYNLIPVLTAQENVSLPLVLLNMRTSERRSRAEYALEIVGLKERMKHYPSQLSGGQEQRVAIARAIITDPDLVVADEPTGDLDRKSADDILTILKELNVGHKKTIVMVTHDPHAAEYAQRVIHLDKGELTWS